MTDSLPTIEPSLLASIIEEAPRRVRTRLEKEPGVAMQWEWNVSEKILVRAGAEQVCLKPTGNHISSIDQIGCSCLLSPKCFHVLACISRLSTMTGQSALERSKTDEFDRGEPSIGIVESSIELRQTAQEVRRVVGNLLDVGARAAGPLVQSSLLQVAHRCRVQQLPNLANALLRVEDSIRFFRTRSNQSNIDDLRADIATVLEMTHHLKNDEKVPFWCIGSVRREFLPIHLTRLAGLMAEPVLTGSGYAGVAIYLASDDENLFQVLELRPGDASLIQQAYRGGIELGTNIFSGFSITRSEWTTQSLTASREGRLGKGTKTRWAIRDDSQTPSMCTHVRFTKPLEEQIDSVFQTAKTPNETRSVGWDLIAFDATIRGVDQTMLEVATSTSQSFYLAAAHNSQSTCFHNNLKLLARFPGLRIRILGRVRRESAATVDALALSTPIGNARNESRIEDWSFNFPDSWRGVCNLGLDSLERQHIAKTAVDNEIAEHDIAKPPRADDGLTEFNRRLTAIVLGGQLALPRIDSKTHLRDLDKLRQRHQTCGVTLLERLVESAASEHRHFSSTGIRREKSQFDFVEVYQACEVYVANASLEFHRQHWMAMFEHDETQSGDISKNS